jgi:hypothetical protein
MRRIRVAAKARIAAIGALALVVAVAGVAYAAGSGSGKITVCVKKQGGQLYKAKKCGKGARKLSWNITGPAGAAGAPGRNGANGTNGTNGTNGINGTNGVSAGIFASGTATLNTPGLEPIASATLPAGDYIVNGTAQYTVTQSNGSTAVDYLGAVQVNNLTIAPQAATR